MAKTTVTPAKRVRKPKEVKGETQAVPSVKRSPTEDQRANIQQVKRSSSKKTFEKYLEICGFGVDTES